MGPFSRDIGSSPVAMVCFYGLFALSRVGSTRLSLSPVTMAFESEGASNETHLPAQSQEAGQDSRLSGAHEDPVRSKHHQTPPRQRPHAPQRIRPIGETRPTLTSLKGNRDFRRLRKGQFAGTRLLSLRWRSTRTGVVRVGIVVSKKVGKAVVRNRVRRRLREALRQLVSEPFVAGAMRRGLPSFDMVVIARPEAAQADFWKLRAALVRAFDRGGLR